MVKVDESTAVTTTTTTTHHTASLTLSSLQNNAREIKEIDH
jgi:hypothetical protein